MGRHVELVLPHLDPVRHARRTKKQKKLKQLVVVDPRVNAAIAKEGLKDTTVIDFLKNGHADPWLMFMRVHTQPIVP